MGFLGPGILAFANTSSPGQQGSPFAQMLPFLLIFAVFYFLVFAPMKKKQRKHKEMIDALKAGDRVVTNGGIHGTVVGVDDQVVQVRIADGVRVDISKGAVASLHQVDG